MGKEESEIDKKVDSGYTSVQTVTKQPKVLRAKKAKPAGQDLVAVHNLSQENLLHAHEVGGLAAPSLAVAGADHPFDAFGDVTLVAPHHLIDPARGVPVFDADVYSPRYPDVRQKVDDRKYREFREWLKPHAEKTDTYLGDADEELERRGPEDAIRYKLKEPLMSAYLAEKGRPVAPAQRAKAPGHDLADTASMRAFMAKHGIAQDVLDDPQKTKAFHAAARQAVEENAKGLADPSDPTDVDYYRKAFLDEGFDPQTGQMYFGPADKLRRSMGDLDKQVVDKNAVRVQQEASFRELAGVPPEEGGEEHPEHAARLKAQERDYEAWAHAKLKPVMGDRYIPKHLDSGGTRKIPYTIDNVLKEMTRKVRGGETGNSIGTYGLGAARSFGAKKFKSLDEVRQHRARIVPKEEFERIKKASDERFESLVDQASHYHPDHGGFGMMGALAQAIGESYRRGHYLYKELEESGFKDVPPALRQKIGEFADNLRTMPSQYFEAKPQRVVGLHEFQGAAVPEDVDPRVLEALRAHGVTNVHKYRRESSFPDAKSYEEKRKLAEADRARATRAAAEHHDLKLSEDLAKAEAPEVAHGEPAVIPYVHRRNALPTPYHGEVYNQHLEPAGTYLSPHDPDNPKPPALGEGMTKTWYEYGDAHFQKPWVHQMQEDESPVHWKRVLSDAHGGRRGKVLTNHLLKQGYDGVVALHPDGDVSEMVDLGGARRPTHPLPDDAPRHRRAPRKLGKSEELEKDEGDDHPHEILKEVEITDKNGVIHRGHRWVRIETAEPEEQPSKADASEERPYHDRPQVALIMAYDANGRLLLGVRKDNGKHTLPGGHLEDDEAPAEGAARELREETGLTAYSMTEVPGIRDNEPDKGPQLHVFSALVSGVPHGNLDPDREAATWAFHDVSEGVPPEVWKNLHGPEDDSNVVRQVHRELGKVEADEDLDDLLKTQPAIDFPKLGVERRNDTPIVTTRQQHALHERLIGAAQSKRLTDAGLPHDADILREKVSKRAKGYLNRRSAIPVSAGVVSTTPGSRAGYVLHETLIPAKAPEEYRSPNAAMATQIHEDFHQAVSRAADKHGLHRDRILFALRQKVPVEARSAAAHLSLQGMGVSPKDPNAAEEFVANLHSYLNNPEARARVFRKLHFDQHPEAMQAYDIRIKQAYRAYRRAAAELVPQDLRGWNKRISPNPVDGQPAEAELVPQDLRRSEGLDKRISDIPAGQPAEGGGVNYSHVLTPEHRAAGYSLHAERGVPSPHLTVRALHQGKPVGMVTLAPISHNVVEPHSQLHEKHRGKGLGIAMYEAAYRHAQTMGVDTVQGDAHTKEAGRVHEALARKHGLQYKVVGKGAFRAPYEYALKSEDLTKMAVVHDDPQKPATVWRVEGPGGKGPYIGTSPEVKDIAHQNSDENGYYEQPGPHTDFSDQDQVETGISLNPPRLPEYASDEEAKTNYDTWRRQLGDSKQHRFGFESPEHAMRWFGQPALNKLKEHGFELRPVQAAKVWRSQSGKQVIYLPHHEDVAKSEDLAKMALIHDDPATPKTIWRVQNQKGQGPYTSHGQNDLETRRALRTATVGSKKDGNQPAMHDDFPEEEVDRMGFPDMPDSPFKFGFEHPDHARAWFGDEGLATMKQHGYDLVPVPARKVYRSLSGKQIAYLPVGAESPLEQRNAQRQEDRDRNERYRRRASERGEPKETWPAWLTRPDEPDEVEHEEVQKSEGLLQHPDARERALAVMTQPLSHHQLLKAVLDEHPEVRHAALKHKGMTPGLLRLACAARRTAQGGYPGLMLVDFLEHPMASKEHAKVALASAEAHGQEGSEAANVARQYLARP